MGYRYSEHRYGTGLYSWEFEWQAQECGAEPFEPVEPLGSPWTPVEPPAAPWSRQTPPSQPWAAAATPSTVWTKEGCQHG